jgi:hypothetical protein
MKLNLKMKDRLVLATLLPEKSDYLTLLDVQKAREVLNPTDEERKELQMKPIENGLTWKDDKDSPKEIEVNDVAVNEVIRALKKLDEEKGLEDKHLILYKNLIEKK